MAPQPTTRTREFADDIVLQRVPDSFVTVATEGKLSTLPDELYGSQANEHVFAC